MADKLKIRVKTGNVRNVIVMNLGTFNEETRSWKLEMEEEFISKLIEAFSTPEVIATGVDVVFERG